MKLNKGKASLEEMQHFLSHIAVKCANREVKDVKVEQIEEGMKFSFISNDNGAYFLTTITIGVDVFTNPIEAKKKMEGIK